MQQHRAALSALLRPEFKPGGGFNSPGFLARYDALLDAAGMPRDETAPAGASFLPPRRIGSAGLALIKSSEGLRLTAYRCPAGVVTIGYGSTGPHVRMGMTITEAEAEALLLRDLERFESGVAARAGTATQGQYDAMVSLAFNIGLDAFGRSTLLRRHRAGRTDEAELQFGVWNQGGGRVLPGLVTRRAAEAAMYRGAA